MTSRFNIMESMNSKKKNKEKSLFECRMSRLFLEFRESMKRLRLTKETTLFDDNNKKNSHKLYHN